MMRRSRISVKPNFRPGGRSITAGEQASQTPADGDNTLPPITAEETVRPSPSPEQIPPGKELAETAGVKNTPSSPAQKASADLNNGAPSSGTCTSAAVSQRRMRISATPKLSGPKATSTPRPSTRMPRSTPSALLKETPIQIPDVLVSSVNLSESSLSGSTVPTEVTKQASPTHTLPSPCEPSTSGLFKAPVHEAMSVEESPPSPQPGQGPQHPPHEPVPLTYPVSASDMPSDHVKLSHFEPGSPQKRDGMSSDKEKILRALKLKELMKIERRKDIKKGKKRVPQQQEYTPVDRSKMTMRDLLYYLPNTSPMRCSTVNEEDQDETIVSSSAKMPEMTPEQEEEEEEDECVDEAMLVPKVRVAEDGSLILDEESLTVRVQRTSDIKVVESTALFERGSTSTYSSFRNIKHVKSWSVRETDMFFLAISMVGTDFSLIGQLLPHRSRTEIKNKFKKEEKVNSWRIDKAFRNKRPFDREFFSFLLERILAKDKEKGKSIKLVMTTPKKRGKARGKKAKDHEQKRLSGSGDEDLNMEDGGCVDAEKENQDHTNVNESDESIPAKKRKRTCKVKDKDESYEEQGKRKKKSKRTKKTKEEMQSPEGDAEGECGLFNTDTDTVNANKELGSSISVLKKKRKCTKKAKDDQRDETPVEGSKGRQCKKSLEVSENPEDSIGANEENGIVEEDDSGVAMKKRRCSQKKEPKGGKPAKRTKSIKPKKSKKGTVDEGSTEVGEAAVTAESGEASDANKIDALVPAEGVDKAPQRSARRPKKPVPTLVMSRHKKSPEPETPSEADETQENQYENISTFLLEEGVSHSEAEQLQKQAAVMLERTPPRMENILRPSEAQQESNETVSSMNLPVSPSPAVSEASSCQQIKMQRAEKVKRNLTAGKKNGKSKATMDQDEAEHDEGTSTEDLKSPTALQMIVRESEDAEPENSLDEDLIDFSYLHHLDSQMFQRRPIVALSREEVNMILNVQDQTAEEDPSVSPLDLSLNTELSFQLQCSNLLGEDTEAYVESEENGGTLQKASSSVALEKSCEGMDVTEPVMGQFEISTPTEVNSQANKIGTPSLENPEQLSDPNADKDMASTEPLVALERASGELIYTKSDASVTHEALVAAFPEAATQATWASRDVIEDSKTSLQRTREIKKTSEGSLLVSSEDLVESQGSIVATTGIMEENHGSVFAKELLQGSAFTTPEVREGSQGFVVATPEVKEGIEGSVLASPEIKEVSQDFVVTTPEIKVGSVVAMPESMKESQKSVMSTLDVKEGPEGSMVDTPVVKEHSQEEDLHGSLPTSSKIWETSKRSVMVTPEIKEGSLGSISVTTEIKERSEESIVAAQVVKKDSQEEVEQAIIPCSTSLSSGASVSSEHGVTLKRRSRFLKPKPNFRGASKVTHSSPKPKNTEPQKISSERLIFQTSGKDQHCKDSSMGMYPKDEEKPQSCPVNIKSETSNVSLSQVPTPPAEVPVDYSENQTTDVSSGPSRAVPEQENIIKVSMIAADTEESQLASEQTSNIFHTIPPCASVAEDLHMMDASCSWSLPEQTAEQERTGHVTCNSEELCAPAKIIHSAGDGNREEEPTFVLTLYEIPVPEAYLASAINDSVITSPLLLSDQPPLPSVPESPSYSLAMETSIPKGCVDISQNELLDTFSSQEKSDGKLSISEEKTEPRHPRGHVQQTLAKAASLNTKMPQETVEASEVSAKLGSKAGWKESPELLLQEDLKSMHESIVFPVKISQCIASMSQDTERCEGVSHMVLSDVLVPVSEVRDELAKFSTPCEKEEYSTVVSTQLFTGTQDSKNTQSLAKEIKAPARRRGKLQPKLVHRASGKEDFSKTNQPTSSQAVLPTQQNIVPPVMQDSSTVSAKPEMEDILEATKLQLTPKPKEGSVLDPLGANYAQQKLQMTPCTISLSRCVGPIHQESHTVPAFEEQVDICVAPTTPEEKVAGIPSQKDISNTSPDTISALQEVKMPRRRGKLQVKPNLRERTSFKNQCLKLPQLATESDSSQTILAAPLKPELEKETGLISTKLVTGDSTVKCEASSKDKESSLSVICEEASLQESHGRVPLSEMMTISSSDSLSMDLEEAKEDYGGDVSHIILPDMFVPVSEKMGGNLSNDWLGPVKSSPPKEKVNLSMKQEVRLEKIIKEKESEESKKSETPNREREDKQLVKKTCATKLEMVHVLGCPEVEAKGSSNEGEVNPEEKLQRKHQTMPSSFRVSRCTDSLPVDKDENKDVSQMVLIDAIVPVSEDVGEDLSTDWMEEKKTAVFSPSFAPSEGSKELPILEENKSESPLLMKKKSLLRKKGKVQMKHSFAKQTVKKNEPSKSDSPDSEGCLNLTQTVSQTRQLTITAWAKKKSAQAGPKLEAEDLSKTSHMESRLKAKESSSSILTTNKNCQSVAKTSSRSKLQSTSLDETQKTCGDVSHISSLPASKNPGEATSFLSKVETTAHSSTVNVSEANEEPSGLQLKRSTVTPEAKPPLKPTLSKRTSTKDKGKSSRKDPLPSCQLTSPTRQCTTTARVKEGTEQPPSKQTGVSLPSRMRSECKEGSLLASDTQSPKHSSSWPRIILPRVKALATEAGSSSDSTTVSSPVRISASTHQPMTPPQKSSPVITSKQHGSPTSSEDPEDEPSRVSEFFLCDIFTEVEDGD